MDMRRLITALGFVVAVVVFMASLPSRGTAARENAIRQSTQPVKPVPEGRGGRTTPPREREHVIEGTKADDVLDGGEGDDWLFGFDGNDVLRGGAGRDTLEGGPGEDSLVGGAGQDVLDGGAGRDTVAGGDDNDFMDGGDEEDSLDGGPGNDDIEGGDGDDLLTGGAGDDTLAGGDGNDVISGGDGVDRVLGRDGDDRLSGGPGDDIIEGGDGRDALNGDNGNDVLDGGESEDVARGGLGDDKLDGGSANDVLLGEAGNDLLLGSGGDDSLDGGEDHDTLLGGDGRDFLTGGAGEDVLLGGIGADIIRAGSESDVIVLRAGDVGVGEIELVDGGTDLDTVILNGFPTIPAPTTDTADRALTDPVTRGTYRLFGVEQVQHAHLFTNMTSAESMAAAFVLVNPSPNAVTGRVVFFNDEGAALAQKIGDGAAAPTYSFTVPPLGRVAFNASGAAQKAPGSALVIADRPIGGLVQTTLTGRGAIGGGESRLLDSFIIPVLKSTADGTDTGVAIFASTARSNVKLTLHRTTGEEVDTPNQGAAEIEIPANGHRVVFVSELFAWAGEDFEGTLTIEGAIDRPQEGGPLAGTGLQREGKTGGITTFPVIPVAPLAASGPLHFASFPVGGDSRSTITLVNPSPANRARGTLVFYDEAGQSRAIALNGRTAAATVPYDIAPLGSLVLSAPAGGALRPGTAQAITKEGVVGGVVHTTSPTRGTLSVAASEIVSGFVAPAHRNRSAGINTQVALSSTQSPLTLTLVLRDARGSEVPGGRAQIQLAANAAVLQTIDGLFPKVDTNDFQGTLSATAEGGTVAVSVMQIGGEANVISALPVVAVRE